MTVDNNRTALFLLFAVLSGALAFTPLRELLLEGRPSEYYSHIPLIPAISAYLLFRERDRIFIAARPARLPGLALLVLGGGLYVLSALAQTDLTGRAALVSSAVIAVLGGGCLITFGPASLRKACFPIGFLIFMVPPPAVVMKLIVTALAAASAGVVHLLFSAIGVPFVQEGASFYLPIIDIEVAQQCSGIRSSIALVITTVLAGHFFLDKSWKRVALVLAVFPVTIFKNGIRIIALYLLSVIVDMRIIEGGFLHRSGGFLFFGLGLVILGIVLWILRVSGGGRAHPG